MFESMEPRLLLDGGPVVINEIMYHAPVVPEPLGEEYVELFNTTPDPINLNGWSLTRGAGYTFGDVTIPANGYLVVAADVDAFLLKYPAFPGTAVLVGGPTDWTARLSNAGEDLELEDSSGVRVDLVGYADEGEWSVRIEGPLDNGHTGWAWSDATDGGGKSLELINPALTNNEGQNWAASVPDGGTPGAANSVASTDVAPLILDVEHLPAIPRTTDPVTITCRIIDELGPQATVTLYTRIDDVETVFTAHPMADDGLSNDGAAGDGVYGVVLAPYPNNLTIVEFYVEATDAAHSRTWPAPVPGHGQVTNALFQVDDSYDPTVEWTPGSMPVYRIIMTRAERDELVNEIYATDFWSDAQMNATFVSIDGVESRARYQVGIRNRGAGSRSSAPHNFRVNFTHDDPWQGVSAVNLNHRYGYSSVLGSAVWHEAGLSAAQGQGVEVRLNGVDRAYDTDLMYGAYVAMEALDTDWAAHWFPDDSAGDLYRCSDQTGGEADLRYLGTNPDSYREAYNKQTNEPDDRWVDLINLTYILNNASEENFLEEISQVIDVNEWLRFLAVDSLAGNLEGGLTSGRGDDYAMYQGVNDPRFLLVPHDLDTLFGLGDHTADLDHSIFIYDGVDGLYRLLHHPDTVPLYYAQFLDLIDTVFAAENFDPMVDQLLGGWVSESEIAGIKAYVYNRIYSAGGVLDQIPMDGLTATSGLPVQGDYPHTTTDSFQISGTADGTARSVTVNGYLATWDPRNNGQWAFDSTNFSSGYASRMLVTDDAGVSYHVPTVGEDPLVWTATGYAATGWVNEFAEGQAGVLVSEVATGDTRFVEIQNVSDSAIETAGWTVLLNDPSGGASGVFATPWNLPASVPGHGILYQTDSAGDHYWGAAIPWQPEGAGWVMVLDASGNVMDFVAWGYTAGEIASLSVDYGGFTGITAAGHWTGDGAEPGTTGPGTPTGGFVAFNDTSSGTTSHPNATRYRANGTASGDLLDIVTGVSTGVTLTTTASGVTYQTGAQVPWDGTPAYNVFNGYVDFASGTNASLELQGADYYTYRFSGLDTGDIITYDFDGTAIRGGGYEDRWTLVTLQGATGTVDCAGLGVVVVSPTQVALWTGENDWADQGFVVRWTNIDPGSGGDPGDTDGEFSVVCTQYTGVVPTAVHASGLADGDKGYGLTGIRLTEVAPSGPLSWLKRTGHTDGDGAGDFVRADAGSQGAQNSGLTVPFGTTSPATMGVGFSGGAYDPYVATDVSAAMLAANASLWSRIAFTAPDLTGYDALKLRVRYDDGFVAYLNGTIVAEANAPASPAWDSAATGAHDGSGFVEFDISDHLGDLVVGTNVLAIHGLNAAASDPDFLVQGELVATRGTPSAGLDLQPGVNRLYVESLDGMDGFGNVVDSSYIDIWYDTGYTHDYLDGSPTGALPLFGTPTNVDLVMTTCDSYLPGTPVLVRLEVVDQAERSVYRDLWDATATLDVLDNAGIVLSTSEVTLYNGLGSALVTFTGSGDFQLRASVIGLEATQDFTDWSAQPVTTVSGTLASSQTWSGIYHVTGGDFSIPAGMT
ncbi:MAG: CotH kinase family protein, partial [Planctomycetes bacterium]|nr:CotH kinase family protein [Planctomycetota bacterium]